MRAADSRVILPADALATFGKLRSLHPEYLPVYLMAGQVLLGEQRNAEAREWLEVGVTLATTQNAVHALSELESALESC